MYYWRHEPMGCPLLRSSLEVGAAGCFTTSHGAIGAGWLSSTLTGNVVSLSDTDPLI